MFLIGYITTTHGIKGEVKVKNLSDYDRFKANQLVFIHDKSLKIEHVKKQHDRLIVKFHDINSMNDALLLKDQEIYVKDKPQLDEAIHYQDLLGKSVYTTDHTFVGQVKFIREVPQGHLLEVDVNGSLKLIPFVDAFIKDISEDKIIMELIEGLL
jgi:16S rRNA processing protein RimM